MLACCCLALFAGVCVSQHAGTSACKMAHNAAFDIASLVLDGGAVVKLSEGTVVLVFNSV